MEISAINWTAAPQCRALGGFDQPHGGGKHSSGINLKRRDLDRWPLIKAISGIWGKKTKLLEDLNDGTVLLNQMPGLNNHALKS